MNRTERYLTQATRGLLGQKKVEAHQELRGAIEDKIWRYTLAGLSADEAESAALRDLGSAHVVARDLHRVHTAPSALRATLLLGVAGLLSLQAVAQVATIRSASAFDPVAACRLPSDEELNRASPQMRAMHERFLASFGGREGYLKQCQSGAFQSTGLLKVADLLAALTSAGITTTNPPQRTPTTPLQVKGVTGAPEATFQTVDLGGERYLDSTLLIPYLKRVTALPLSLTGDRNPTLRVGSLALQLGTAAAPVLTADLLTAALIDERRTNIDVPIPVVVRTVSSSEPVDPVASRLAVPGMDGEYFAVVQNMNAVDTQGDAPDMLWVRARVNGTLPLTNDAGARPQIVKSLADLDRATANGVEAAVVYRVETGNLRHLKLLPVPPNQVRVVQP